MEVVGLDADRVLAALTRLVPEEGAGALARQRAQTLDLPSSGAAQSMQ